MKKTDKQGFKANKHFFRKSARHLGFEGLSAVPKQNYTVAINRSIFPIFAYSDNINGGNLSQTIQIGELTFVGEEDANAKSGLIIGGGAVLGSFGGEGSFTSSSSLSSESSIISGLVSTSSSSTRNRI